MRRLFVRPPGGSNDKEAKVFLAEVFRGSCFRVLAVGTRDGFGNGNLPFLNFRGELLRQQPGELTRLDGFLRTATHQGLTYIHAHAKRLQGHPLYEFRIGRAIRLFWIFGVEKSIICLTGFRKQSTRTPRRELERAEMWRRAYLDQRPFPGQKANHNWASARFPHIL